MAAWIPLYMAGVGLLMIGLWAVLLARRQVPELTTEPWSIGFHMAAELVCAAGLLVAAALAWQGHTQAARWAAVALGMLLYTVINSAGYYAQRRVWPAVAMFGLLLLGTVAAMAML